MSAEHLTAYFAYGLNVHKEGLRRRCPDAIEIGAGRLDDYRLRFHRVASISPEPDRTVDGALWAISEPDLSALDSLEGYPRFTGASGSASTRRREQSQPSPTSSTILAIKSRPGPPT